MSPRPLSRKLCLAIAFWAGCTALIFQMYGVRVLFLFFVETTHAVAIAVSSFLAGLAAASVAMPRLARNAGRTAPLIGVMMLAAGLYGIALLANYPWIPLWLDALHRNIAAAWLAAMLKYLTMWLVLFPPAFFLGGVFPLITALYLTTPERSARDTGTVYFWDTLGAILGALIAGFVLLPYFGLRVTVMVASLIAFLIFASLLERRRHAWCAVLLLLPLVAYETHRAVQMPEQRFALTNSGHAIPTGPEDVRFGTVLFQEESPYGRVTVGDMGRARTLFVNHRMMCDTLGYSSEEAMADIAMASQPPGSTVLNIGLGCGLTASQLARHPHTQKLDIVEINPIIPRAARYFSQQNHNVLDAPNVTLHLQDGAEWLRREPRKFDAIVIDIEEVSVIYSSPLYTREYLAYARERLRPGGVLALWSFTVGPEFTRVMANTLRSVFPYVEIHPDNKIHPANSTIYYASTQPLTLKTPVLSAEAGAFVNRTAALTLEDINTLEHPALERYYNGNKIFDLPEYYREEFVR